MLKREIANELKTFTGAGMITKTQLSRFMGYSRVDKLPARYLKGLKKVGTKYFIKEVAERLSEEQFRD